MLIKSRAAISVNSYPQCRLCSTDKVVTSSSSTDVAFLKIDLKNISYLSLASSRNVGLGEEVFTIGYPLAHMLGVDPKFTDGVISAKSGLNGEPIPYQITVPIQPGNSGGPLVNLHGEVVGVITSTASSSAFFREVETCLRILTGQLNQTM